MLKMRKRFIAPKISYIPASNAPLSADVGIIEGEEFFYLFDVGADEVVAEFLNVLPKPKKLILSHFHPDHIGNIGRIVFAECYVGANTKNYLKNYLCFSETEPKEIEELLQEQGVRIVDTPIMISDGVEINIFPLPSSHAKGSLAVTADGAYTFLGDATYCTGKKGKAVYNTQLLKEQIDLLKTLSSDYVLLSHAEPYMKERKQLIRQLEDIYGSRKKGEPYIEAE